MRRERERGKEKKSCPLVYVLCAFDAVAPERKRERGTTECTIDQVVSGPPVESDRSGTRFLSPRSRHPSHPSFDRFDSDPREGPDDTMLVFPPCSAEGGDERTLFSIYRGREVERRRFACMGENAVETACIRQTVGAVPKEEPGLDRTGGARKGRGRTGTNRAESESVRSLKTASNIHVQARQAEDAGSPSPFAFHQRRWSALVVSANLTLFEEHHQPASKRRGRAGAGGGGGKGQGKTQPPGRSPLILVRSTRLFSFFPPTTSSPPSRLISSFPLPCLSPPVSARPSCPSSIIRD